MGRGVLVFVTVAFAVSAAVVAGVGAVGVDSGPVTGVVDSVAVAVDVSPEPLPRNRLATLHIRVRNTETTSPQRVVVTPFWPDGSRFEGVEFGHSGWELRCSSSCERDPRLAIRLAPGDSATANVTLRVPESSSRTSLLGLSATEELGSRMLLAKEVPIESGPPGGRDGWLPELSVVESLAVIVATVVAVVSLALRLHDRRRSGS